MLTHFSLFTGIGGIDLAAEQAGFETVGQCEWADYPTKVLEKHWPNVLRWRDIRDVTAESFYNRTGLRTVDVISGGFPCQPFSVAGKRKGEDDDRYLWPEMLRVISELKPRWVVGENVAGIVNMALEQVCIDLENQGYEVQPFIIPACGVGACHKRERVFIVAYSELQRLSRWERQTSRYVIEAKILSCLPLQEEISAPFVCGTDDGIPNRTHRLKCLGNAVVPQQVYPIFHYIAEIERLG